MQDLSYEGDVLTWVTYTIVQIINEYQLSILKGLS